MWIALDRPSNTSGQIQIYFSLTILAWFGLSPFLKILLNIHVETKIWILFHLHSFDRVALCIKMAESGLNRLRNPRAGLVSQGLGECVLHFFAAAFFLTVIEVRKLLVTWGEEAEVVSMQCMYRKRVKHICPRYHSSWLSFVAAKLVWSLSCELAHPGVGSWFTACFSLLVSITM